MKKKILLCTIIVLVAALAVVPVLAKPSIYKGQVNSIEENQITLLTKKNQTIIVISPDEFEISSLLVGDWVIAKGEMQGEDLIAEWIKKIGKDSSEYEDEAEGKKDNSAYCDAEKKQEPHPMASALAEKFDTNPEWVMDHFCGGYSMGAIMLALKTQAINNETVADEILAKRANGQGWGAIWKELKMIGSEREAKTPPGQLKKP